MDENVLLVFGFLVEFLAARATVVLLHLAVLYHVIYNGTVVVECCTAVGAVVSLTTIVHRLRLQNTLRCVLVSKRFLAEPLLTFHALERLVYRMDFSQMTFEVLQFIETPMANLAFVQLLCRMQFHVLVEMAQQRESLLANAAMVFPFDVMELLVSAEAGGIDELLAAKFAVIGIFARVRDHVHLEIVLEQQLLAELTGNRFLILMLTHVRFVVAQRTLHCVAYSAPELRLLRMDLEMLVVFLNVVEFLAANGAVELFVSQHVLLDLGLR